MKRMAKDWLKVLILLLDEVVIVAVVLGILWYFNIKLPLWVAVPGALLLGLLAGDRARGDDWHGSGGDESTQAHGDRPCGR